ncbi:MAG: gamma-glutamyltransferase [Burkholderiales bacterium]|nr:gamma-glutamyltransferase [Burkholderiales bacterium]
MKRWFLIVLVALFGASAHDAVAQRAAIASAHPLATEAGYRMLRQGGNAFDAAVAVAATLAVVEPFASGLGGGGFWLLYRASDGDAVMLDARETAPLNARSEMYLDRNGEVVAGASREGAKAASIPGTPAALAWLSKRYGNFPLIKTMAPAMAYARDGFSTNARYARIARMRQGLLRDNESAASIFLDRGEPPMHGFRLRQPALARTLAALARYGHAGFYDGRVADELVRSVNAAGGIWQKEDLDSYRVIERAPARITYRGLDITTASLPSAGGATLAQSLNILETLPLAETNGATRAHLVVEALRRAYHDRARYLGDPDFIDAPMGRLSSETYAATRAASIDPRQATPSAVLAQIDSMPVEGTDTSHFSIIDAAGNRVAATLSINNLFGSGIVAGDTGVLLNNEMDDFAVKPGAANTYRLTGDEANAIEPGKRPLSSMSPTFVEDARGVLILGSSGGSRIMSQVLLAILDYARPGPVDVVGIVGAPRYHHQYLPDRIDIEPEGLPAEWVTSLEAKGHSVHRVNRKWGNMQAVWLSKKTGQSIAVGDPRTAAGWAGWF